MSRAQIQRSVCALGAVVALSGCADNSAATETTRGVVVSDAWIRETGEGTNGAAYFAVSNTDSTAIGIDSIVTDAAKAAELHETTLADGVARMIPQTSMTIQPDSTLVMEPGGLHVMLVELSLPLVRGDSVPLRLHLSNGKVVDTFVQVRAR